MSDMGDVEITLDGKTETLRSTARAAIAVSAMGGGFGEVYRRLAAMDLQAYIDVVAVGLGKKPSDVTDVVWRTGLPALAEPLATYVGLLSNGGKPPRAAGDEPQGEV